MQKSSAKIGNANRKSLLLDHEKKKLVYNAVTKSHSTYFPLKWLFSSQGYNKFISRIHKNSLRSVYYDASSTI